MVDLNFLGVTVDRDLTPDGKSVLAKTFLPRSEAAGSKTPARAGTRAGLWIAPVYRPDAPAVARIRGMFADALLAGKDREVVFPGDSKTKGTLTGGGKQPDRSFPGVIRRASGGVEGFITAAPPTEDDRWTLTNMDRGADVNLDGVAPIAPGSPSALTFAYGEKHTGGAFWMYSASGGSVQVSVDGAAPQTINVPAGGSYRQIPVAVSGEAAHSYSLTLTAIDRVRGFRPTFAGPRLKITNLGRPSSSAINWAAGAGGSIGLWDGFRTIIPNPDAIFCQHGTNNASGGGIPELFTQIVGVTDNAVVIAPGGIGTTPDTQYGAMYLTVWDQADRLNLPLIDFASVLGNYDAANARGLMADIVHENMIGQAWVAAAILHLFGLSARSNVGG